MAPRPHKLVLLGDQSVGKTSIVTRFMYNTFDDTYQTTIGIDFAGQERFRTLIPAYLRDCNAAIVVFDVANRASFLSVDRWIGEVHAVRGPDETVTLVVVGNKTDLGVDARTVSVEDTAALAQRLGVVYLETSAKSGLGVGALFRHVAAALAAASTALSPQPRAVTDTVELVAPAPAAVPPGACAC